MIARLRIVLRELLARQPGDARTAYFAFDAAIQKAMLSARSSGRISLCADEVLLSILDNPAVAAYLENEGYGLTEMRADLEANVSKWPRASAATTGASIGASWELHAAIQRAVARKLSLNQDRDLTVVDLLQALLTTKERNISGSDSEMRRKVESLPRTERLLDDVAVLHFLAGHDEGKIAKDLGIAEELVRQEVERTREILLPDAKIDLTKARERVTEYLRQTEERMDYFGSGLPGYENPNVHLVVTHEQEYEFGWVFFYNTEDYRVSQNFRDGLIGNAPLIVDRADAGIYATGTAHPLEHYIDEYRKGKRRRAELWPREIPKFQPPAK